MNKFYIPLGISVEAAEWIVQNGRIVGVGVDTASVDAGRSDTYDSHHVFNSNGLYLLENVNIKPELPGKDIRYR